MGLRRKRRGDARGIRMQNAQQKEFQGWDLKKEGERERKHLLGSIGSSGTTAARRPSLKREREKSERRKMGKTVGLNESVEAKNERGTTGRRKKKKKGIK